MTAEAAPVGDDDGMPPDGVGEDIEPEVIDGAMLGSVAAW